MISPAAAEQAFLLVALWSVPISLWLALVVPPALKAKSWSRFRRLSVLVWAAMGLPSFAFLFAVLAAPMSKAQAKYGAFDSFQAGKFALLPLLLWSLASCYSDAISSEKEPVRAWVTLGLAQGFLIHTVWMGHAHIVQSGRYPLFLLIALAATPIWYGWRAINRYRQAAVSPRIAGLALLGSVPFWVYTVVLSKRYYADLPETSDCFVVTAASRGHHRVVGPWTTVTHRGELRVVNTQLATFWAFEDTWRCWSPTSHRFFRRIYGVLGPAIATVIAGPLRADLMYVLLKPLEFCARLLLLSTGRSRAERL